MSSDVVLQKKIMKYEAVLRKVLSMLEIFGVVEGRGQDGALMKEVRDALDGSATDMTKVLSQPNVCPLCGHRDFRECDCPPDAQWAAMN